MYKQYHVAALELALKRNMMQLKLNRAQQATTLKAEMVRDYARVEKLMRTCESETESLQTQNDLLEEILNSSESSRLEILKRIRNDQFDKNCHLLRKLQCKSS